MCSKSLQCHLVALIGIAINASMRTGIVHANVTTGDTSALFARWLELENQGTFRNKISQQIAVYTMGQAGL
jgi:hypothetical protein